MPNYRSFAKALAPLVLGVIAVVIQWSVTGTLNAGELSTAIAAVVTAAVVYFVPNRQVLPVVTP